MAAESAGALAETFVRIRTDNSEAIAGLNRFRGSFRRRMDGFKKMAVISLSVVGLGAGIRGLWNLGKSLVMAGDQIETLRNSFGTMLKTKGLADAAGQADMLIDRARKFTATTPFTEKMMSGAVTAFLPFSQNMDDLFDKISAIGEAASVSAEGLSAFPRIGRGISQMYAKGKIQAEEMMQLAEAGIPAWQALAKAMGVSTAEVQKMSQSGKLGVEEINKFVNQLGEDFAGNMQKQSQTVAGLTTTIVDTIRTKMTQAMAPVRDLVQGAFSRVAKFVQSEKFQGVMERVGEIISNIAGLIRKAFESPLAKAAMKFVAIAGASGILVGAIIALKAAFAAVLSVVAPILPAMLAIGTAVWGIKKAWDMAMSSSKAEAIKKDLRDIWTNLKLIWENIRNTFMSVVNALRRAFGGVSDNVTDKVGGIVKTVTGAIETLTTWIGVLSSNWEETWEVIKLSASIAVASIESKWATGIESLTKMWEDWKYTVIEVFAGAVNQMRKLWMNTIGWVQKRLTEVAIEDNMRGEMARKVLGYDPREGRKVSHEGMMKDVDKARERMIELQGLASDVNLDKLWHGSDRGMKQLQGELGEIYSEVFRKEQKAGSTELGPTVKGLRAELDKRIELAKQEEAAAIGEMRQAGYVPREEELDPWKDALDKLTTGEDIDRDTSEFLRTARQMRDEANERAKEDSQSAQKRLSEAEAMRSSLIDKLSGMKADFENRAKAEEIRAKWTKFWAKMQDKSNKDAKNAAGEWGNVADKAKEADKEDKEAKDDKGTASVAVGITQLQSKMQDIFGGAKDPVVNAVEKGNEILGQIRDGKGGKGQAGPKMGRLAGVIAPKLTGIVKKALPLVQAGMNIFGQMTKNQNPFEQNTMTMDEFNRGMMTDAQRRVIRISERRAGAIRAGKPAIPKVNQDGIGHRIRSPEYTAMMQKRKEEYEETKRIRKEGYEQRKKLLRAVKDNKPVGTTE